LFATGVVYTGGKFAARVVDTGGNLSPASLPPRFLVLADCQRCNCFFENLKGDFLDFSSTLFNTASSAALQHYVEGCWDRNQDYFDFSMGMGNLPASGCPNLTFTHRYSFLAPPCTQIIQGTTVSKQKSFLIRRIENRFQISEILKQNNSFHSFQSRVRNPEPLAAWVLIFLQKRY
jgi:hypothetical protein